MWLILATISVFMQSLVNYIDEYLTNNNKVSDNNNVSTKIGGLVLISTLMSFTGAGVMMLLPHDPTASSKAITLALISSFPMVGMYISYFWLLYTYPVHQVVPLFQMSSAWLLIFGLLMGDRISFYGILGIMILMYGAYILDTGSFRWQIPTKLLLLGIPATLNSAMALFLARISSAEISPIAFSYYQMIGIGVIGVFLFLLVRNFREGFLQRVKKQGKVFLGFSLINETLAEGSFLFGNMAVVVAPVAAYVSAMAGVQSVFVMLLFLFFPQGERTKVKPIQWLATILVVIGVFLLEIK